MYGLILKENQMFCLNQRRILYVLLNCVDYGILMYSWLRAAGWHGILLFHRLEPVD